MAEFTALIQAFGPTGAIIALAIMGMRSVWPWLRDEYLARQVNAIEKLVAHMERSEARMTTLEASHAQSNALLGDMAQDLAVICAALQIDRPSRPRRQIGAQPVKAAR